MTAEEMIGSPEFMYLPLGRITVSGLTGVVCRAYPSVIVLL